MSEEEAQAAQAKAEAEAAAKAAEEAKAAVGSKSISQEEFDKIIGRRVAETQSATEKALLQKLQDETGMTADELKELAKTQKERQEAEKTELQRAQDEIERTKRDTSEKLTTAQTENHKTLVKMCLLDAGISLPEDRKERQQALDRLAPLVTVAPGASEDEILADIEHGVKKQFPTLFEAPAKEPTGNPPSNPSGNPRKPLLGTSDPSKVGSDRAAQMNARRGVKPQTA